MTAPETPARIERTCAELLQEGEPVTFTTVAPVAGISRTTLIGIRPCGWWSRNIGPIVTGPCLAWSLRLAICAPPSKPWPNGSGATRNNFAVWSFRPVAKRAVDEPSPQQ